MNEFFIIYGRKVNFSYFSDELKEELYDKYIEKCKSSKSNYISLLEFKELFYEYFYMITTFVEVKVFDEDEILIGVNPMFMKDDETLGMFKQRVVDYVKEELGINFKKEDIVFLVRNLD